MSLPEKLTKRLVFAAYLCIGMLIRSAAGNEETPQFQMTCWISSTTAVWQAGTPLYLSVHIQNVSTTEVQFGKPSLRGIGELHVFILQSCGIRETSEQPLEATFKVVGEEATNKFPYVEIPPGKEMTYNLRVEFPELIVGVQSRMTTCSLQAENKVDPDHNHLSGHFVWYNHLPLHINDPIVVRSEDEVAAEVKRSEEAGEPLWDLHRIWRGKLLSNAISLSVSE